MAQEAGNMSLVKTALACVTTTLVLVMVYGQQKELIGDDCLGCLCEGSTKCNSSIGCQAPFPGAYLCGAFLITRAYWIDAGKPVIKNDNPDVLGAFERCVNDLYCAAETVRRYLTKFQTEKVPGVVKDCNGDGVIDCHDFAYMHRMGAYGCNDPTVRNTDFYKRFKTCWKVVTDAS